MTNTITSNIKKKSVLEKTKLYLNIGCTLSRVVTVSLPPTTGHYFFGDFETFLLGDGAVDLVARLVRKVHRTSANVVDDLRHERIGTFRIGPRELLPEHFDLIENSQRVHGRGTILHRRVHPDEFVQFDGSLDALHRFIGGDVQPPGHALLEPQVVLGQMTRLQIHATAVLA